MDSGKDLEILTTNLQPSFWRNLKTILRQNKKSVLLAFLFGSQDSMASTNPQNQLEEIIRNLQNQVSSLQQRTSALENKLENQTIYSKYALRNQNKAAKATKIIQ